MPKVNWRPTSYPTAKRVCLSWLAVTVGLIAIGLARTSNSIQHPLSQAPGLVSRLLGTTVQLSESAIGQMPVMDRFFDVNQLSFSPNGQLLATASSGGNTHVWDLQGKRRAKLPGKQVIFSPDGTHIATVTADSKVHLWDLQGKQFAEFKGHDSFSGGLQFSPDGQNLLTIAKGVPQLWNLQGKLLATFEADQPRDTKIQSEQDGIKVNMTLRTLDEGTVFSPDGQTIASAANRLDRYHVARLWDLEGHLLRELQGHQGPINQVAFSPDGKYLATASSDRTACLWDLQGHLLVEFKGQPDPIAKLSFSPDGQYLVTITGESLFKRRIAVWDLQGNQIWEFKPENDSDQLGRWGLSNYAFSPDGKTIAILWARTFRLFDLQQRRELPFKQEPGDTLQGRPEAIIFSPDGQRIAIAADNGAAFLFDLQGRKLATFTGR